MFEDQYDEQEPTRAFTWREASVAVALGIATALALCTVLA